MGNNKDLNDVQESLSNLVSIQKQPGNCDYCEYMRGLTNGLILAEHIAYDSPGAPRYIEAPSNLQVYEVGHGKLAITSKIPELIQCNHSSISTES